MDHEEPFSQRGWSNVKDIMPRIEAAVREREQKHRESNKTAHSKDDQQYAVKNGDAFPALIDLATAEDWTIRDEVLQITAQGITQLLSDKDFSYPGGFAGDPQLLESLAAFFNDFFAPVTPVVPDHIVVAPGAAGCLDTLLYNICDPGDAILIPAPYWSAFDFILKARSSVDIVPVQVDKLEDVMTDKLIDALEQVIETRGSRCKALLMCNPQNPISQCYSRHTIEKALQFCQKHNIHYISDEIYALTNFNCIDIADPVPFCSVLTIDLEKLLVDKSRVHVVWSTSKDWGQNGVRLGALITQHNPKIRTGAALSANTTVSSLTALAGRSILQYPKLRELLALRSERLSRSYTKISAFFQKHDISYLPAYAGIYLFVRVAPSAATWEDEAEVIRRLKEGGVSVASGKSYHMPASCKGWARISFSVHDNILDEVLRRMDKVFSGP